MNTKRKLLLGLLLIAPVSLLVADDEVFDGDEELLCSITQHFECTVDDGCRAVEPADIDALEYMIVDVKDKEIENTQYDEDSGRLVTPIERVERVENKLILQGAEADADEEIDGLGWTMSISDPTGSMTMSAVGENVAFIMFGNCAPLED